MGSFKSETIVLYRQREMGSLESKTIRTLLREMGSLESETIRTLIREVGSLEKSSTIKQRVLFGFVMVGSYSKHLHIETKR